MAALEKMSTPPRRIRRNTKPLDTLKAGAIIVCLLLGCILLAWAATQLMRHQEPPQDLSPKHDRPMWETLPEPR